MVRCDQFDLSSEGITSKIDDWPLGYSLLFSVVLGAKVIESTQVPKASPQKIEGCHRDTGFSSYSSQ
jgi:hypothetical protein